MKAIILAAGMGTRLDKYTKELPKCMLNFEGKTLIKRQVETLRSCGIKEIIIIKGYMSDKIKISNLICYADILYEKRLIEKIISTKIDIGVTVDNDYWDYWKARLENPEKDTESLIIDNEGKIIELGDTNCSLDNAKVRYVGLIKLSKKGVEILKKIYHKNKELYFNKNEQWLRSKSFKKAYMTCMLQAIINEGYKVNPIIISRGWLEFDTNEDYEKMNELLKEGKLDRFYKIS